MKGKVLTGLLARLKTGRKIVGGTAGSGLIAAALEKGGADFIVFYNSARYRQAGVKGAGLAGMLPLADSNGLILQMAGEITGAVESVPVVAGVYAPDPFRNIGNHLRALQEMGVAGIQNWPSAGLIDGRFRARLEKSGYGYGREVDLVGQADEMGLFTCPYAFTPEEAAAMAGAGAAVIVAHLGLTEAVSADLRDRARREAISTLGEICAAVREKNPEAMVLAHGGPVASPEDAAWVYVNLPEIAGYFGASTFEGGPAEKAVSGAVRAFATL